MIPSPRRGGCGLDVEPSVNGELMSPDREIHDGDHALNVREKIEQRERLARMETKLDQNLSQQNKGEILTAQLQIRTEAVHTDLVKRCDDAEREYGRRLAEAEKILAAKILELEKILSARVSAIEVRMAWAVGIGITLYTGFLFFAPAIRQTLFGSS